MFLSSTGGSNLTGSVEGITHDQKRKRFYAKSYNGGPFHEIKPCPDKMFCPNVLARNAFLSTRVVLLSGLYSGRWKDENEI